MRGNRIRLRPLSGLGLALFVVVLSPFLLFSSLLFLLNYLVRRPGPRSLYVAWVYRSPWLYELHSRICTFPVWDDSFENIGILNGRVLYLACGTGNGAAIMRRNGARLVCADLNQSFLRYGARRKDLPRPVTADAYALPFRRDCFDHIVIAVSVHHLLDIERLMEECERVVRVTGSIIIYDPVSLRPRPCRISNTYHDGPIWIFDRDSLPAKLTEEAHRLGLNVGPVSFFGPVPSKTTTASIP